MLLGTSAASPNAREAPPRGLDLHQTFWAAETAYDRKLMVLGKIIPFFGE